MFREFVLLLTAIFAIPSHGEPLFNWGGCQNPLCTVLVTVPRPPISKYEFYVFRSYEAKVVANTDFFTSGARRSWVESPNPLACKPPPPLGAICTILGSFERIPITQIFCSDQEKFGHNRRLISEAENANLPIYKAYVDAPQFLCRGF